MQRFFLLILLPATLITALFPGPAIAEGPVRIAFMGDFLPAGSADPFIARHGYGYLFDGIRPLLTGVDGAVLNLETPLSLGGKAVEGKTYTFRGLPETAQAMAREKVRAVWLANNHILDFGPEALHDTMSHLEASGVAWAGAGPGAGAAYSPALLRLKDLDLHLLGYSNTFPESYWARGSRPGTAFGSARAVGNGVRRAREGSSGPVIVSFHWGAELMEKPKDYQVDLARLAAQSGASLVVGHHPHVPQPIEVYQGVPILYSLGNFSFGSYSRKSRVGLLAVAEFGEDGHWSSLEVYPLDVDNYEVHFSPRPITGREGERIFNRLVRGIDPGEANVSWDGEKGVIVPITPQGGNGESAISIQPAA